jgi:hypothetical protein
VHPDLEVASREPATLDKPAEQKKPEQAQATDEKKATEIPAGKSLYYVPPTHGGDHFALHHNGSTGRFMQ